MPDNRNNPDIIWIAAAYFVEGLPNAVCAGIAMLFYSSMGVGLGLASLITSLIYLPWCVKALWAPVVDTRSTKRNWVLKCAFAMFAIFGALALACLSEFFVAITALLFWLLAFTSATYDISTDGFYILALNMQKQAFYVGLRSAFYKIAAVFAQGVLVGFAGILISRFNFEKPAAWGCAFALCGVITLVMWGAMRAFLPQVENGKFSAQSNKSILSVFGEFFANPHIANILLFVLLYRFAEAQLVKISQPFLIAEISAGGLELPLENVGLLYGTIGTICLFVGSILGGMLIAKCGLRSTLCYMALAINLPNIVYLIMSIMPAVSSLQATAFVSAEQFGYGFGFAGYMAFLLQAATGKNKTSQYALLTAFMAIGYMLPGNFAGYLQELFGYKNFFIWIMLCTLVSFASLIPAYKYLKTLKCRK